MIINFIKNFAHPSASTNAQFWLLNSLGWLGYAFFILLQSAVHGEIKFGDIAVTSIGTITGFVISLGLRFGFKTSWDYPFMARGILVAGLVLLTAALWSYLKFETAIQIYSGSEPDWEMERRFAKYFSWYVLSFFIILSWTALYYGVKYYRMLQLERERFLKATAIAHEAQTKMLRYQLNPHFLFNTLNAISTLILEQDSKLANTMVVELSKFLRYSLENDPLQKVTLAQEVAALQMYLNIEKVRFEERLQVEFNLEDAAKEALVPSLLLQPLIENSIKYAVNKQEHGSVIRVDAKVFAGQLLLQVSDQGPGIEFIDGQLPEYKGVGLRNFRERLQEVYGSNHNCTFSKSQPQGLTISIRLPMETHSPAATGNGHE